MNRAAPLPPQPVSHQDARLALGALVLGALDPSERTAVSEHVAGCPACTAELAELAVLPGLLGRLSTEQAESLAPGQPNPPPELLDRILAQAGSHRARRRRVTTWVAAAASVAAGVVWLLVAGPLAGPDAPASVVVDGWDRVSRVRGEMTLSPTPNGTEVALSIAGVTPGEDCQAVAWTADGRKEVTATWRATYQGEAMVTGSTSLVLADIAGVTIKTPDGRKLLSLAVAQ